MGVEAENLATVDLTRIFTPDAVLPIQVTYQPADRWLQRLCLAVLDDALKCLAGRLREKRKAWEWVLSDADYCLSFTTVCSVLHLDVGAVRRQLGQGDAGSTLPAGVSCQLRQPLSRTPSKIGTKNGARLRLRRKVAAGKN